MLTGEMGTLTGTAATKEAGKPSKRKIWATKIAMEVCKMAILKMDNAGPAAK